MAKVQLICSWGENLEVDTERLRGRKPFIVSSPDNRRHKHVFKWKDNKPVEVMHYYFPDD